MSTASTPRKPSAAKSPSKSTVKSTGKTTAKAPSKAAAAPKPAEAKTEAASAAPKAAPKAAPTAAPTAARTTAPESKPIEAPAPTAAVTAKAEEAAATMQAATAETLKRAEAAVADVKSKLDETVATQQAEAQYAMQASQDALAWNLEQGMIMSKDQFETVTNQFFATLDDATAKTREGVDALFSAGQAWSKGVEEMTRSAFATQQAMMEKSLEAMKGMLGAKTLTDVVDLQSSYTRQAFDGVVAESIKLSEMAMKVANDTTAPISTQVNKAMETAAKAS